MSGFPRWKLPSSSSGDRFLLDDRFFDSLYACHCVLRFATLSVAIMIHGPLYACFDLGLPLSMINVKDLHHISVKFPCHLWVLLPPLNAHRVRVFCRETTACTANQCTV
eukprot:822317_1